MKGWDGNIEEGKLNSLEFKTKIKIRLKRDDIYRTI